MTCSEQQHAIVDCPEPLENLDATHRSVRTPIDQWQRALGKAETPN